MSILSKHMCLYVCMRSYPGCFDGIFVVMCVYIHMYILCNMYVCMGMRAWSVRAYTLTTYILHKCIHVFMFACVCRPRVHACDGGSYLVGARVSHVLQTPVRGTN